MMVIIQHEAASVSKPLQFSYLMCEQITMRHSCEMHLFDSRLDCSALKVQINESLISNKPYILWFSNGVTKNW